MIDRNKKITVEIKLRGSNDLVWSLPTNTAVENPDVNELKSSFDYSDCDIKMITEHVLVSDVERGYFMNKTRKHSMSMRRMDTQLIPFNSFGAVENFEVRVNRPISSVIFAVDNPQRHLNGVVTTIAPHSIADISQDNVRLFSRRPIAGKDTSMVDFFEFPRTIDFFETQGVSDYFGVRDYTSLPGQGHHSIFLPRNPFDYRHAVATNDTWPGYKQVDSLSDFEIKIGQSTRSIFHADVDINFFDEYIPSRHSTRMLPEGMYLYSFADDLDDQRNESTGVLDFDTQGKLTITAKTTVPVAQRPSLRCFVDYYEKLVVENGMISRLAN